MTAASVFIRFLQYQGELPLPATPPSAGDLWPLLGEFRSWMRKHRGLTDTTLDVYDGILAGLLDALGDDVRGYSAEALRSFVLDRARPQGIWRAKSIVVTVRSFVRFLGATGRNKNRTAKPSRLWSPRFWRTAARSRHPKRLRLFWYLTIILALLPDRLSFSQLF
jgi:hypothetical protein